jgi:citrate lyase subunit beta/citryl-CoA lyase
MIRSLLYVPANSARFVAKAHERGADAIILDLEDAVPPGEKDAARAALDEAVPAVGRNGATVFVRVNSEPALLARDVEATCRAGATGLFLPKVRSPDGLKQFVRELEAIELAAARPPLSLVPLLEDPGAILDARGIATASPRVLGIATGGEDLATEMDAEPTAEMLRLPKLLVHLAAKAARILSFGLLRSIADYADTDAIAASAREARALGFDGASCIHPAVVPILNTAFSSSPQALDHASRLVAAFEASVAAGQGAFVFEGRMVDLPIVERARRLLARAGRKPAGAS